MGAVKDLGSCPQKIIFAHKVYRCILTQLSTGRKDGQSLEPAKRRFQNSAKIMYQQLPHKLTKSKVKDQRLQASHQLNPALDRYLFRAGEFDLP